jgi:hypothetical protein
MRVLIVLIAVVLLLAFVGRISFSSGPGRSSINFEKEEIREDTQEMLEAGDQVIDRVRGSVGDSDAVDDRDDRIGDKVDGETGLSERQTSTDAAVESP